jgi:maltose alpha-D-glucosyltransferase/alpha-amylase
VPYFGRGDDEFSMSFHFPLMPRIFMSLAKSDSTPINTIIERTPQLPIPQDGGAPATAAAAGGGDGAQQKRRRSSQCQWGTFLRNHDELTLEMVTEEERDFMWRTYAPGERDKLNLGIRRRLAPLLGNNKQLIKLAHSILLTIIGSPFLYAGDEVGMGDNVELSDRSGCRTPMQWDSTRNAGFSRALESQLFL